MLSQWTRLSGYIELGLTVVAILFPPFTINGGLVEYGFILSGPPSVNAALHQAAFVAGPEGARMARDMVQYGIDFVRLIVEVAAIWGIFFALKRTVLKAAAS